MAENVCEAVELSDTRYGTFDMDDESFICFNCIESDAWKISKNPIVCTIQNHFKDFLAAQHQVPDIVTAGFVSPESPQGQITFSLETYKAWPPENGLSVAFTASVNEEMWYMSCTENREITFKKGHSPTQIPGDRSDAIFIYKDFSKSFTKSFKFESTLHRNYYLGIKEENDKWTLCLKKPADEVDESIKYTVNHV